MLILVREPIDSFSDWLSERRLTAGSLSVVKTRISAVPRRDHSSENNSSGPQISKEFPQIELEVAYSWAGTFAETTEAWRTLELPASLRVPAQQG